MDKSYDPGAIEKRTYERWETNNWFAPNGDGEPYCIVIPPPNVTGSLHMGHGFDNTIQDVLTRYHRMRGHRTLWQPGTDHAGIATQMVVERLLAREGKTKYDVGRDAFIDRVWQWKEESGGTIAKQLRRLGASLDWTRDRFTMDEGCSEAVRHVFVSLYEEGLIYRGKRLVNWDPDLHTAVSDLEVLSNEEQGKLWRFRYPLTEGDGYVVVSQHPAQTATTQKRRPGTYVNGERVEGTRPLQDGDQISPVPEPGPRDPSFVLGPTQSPTPASQGPMGCRCSRGSRRRERPRSSRRSSV